MTNYSRPDERATESEINRSQNRTRELKSGLQTAASFGTTALGGKALSAVMPFINQYIPEDMAFKGINKVMPALGKFIKSGMDQGLTLKSGLEFIKEQFGNQKTSDQKSILQQYSPELHEFMTDRVHRGQSVLEAGAEAQRNSKFKKFISQMEKDHKTPFSSILESIFGTGQETQRQQGLQKFNEKIRQPGVAEQEMQRFQGQYGQQGQNQAGGGQGLDPGVAQILQQGNAILQRFKGQQ